MAGPTGQDIEKLHDKLLSHIEQQERTLAQAEKHLAWLEEKNRALKTKRDELLGSLGGARAKGLQVGVISGDGAEGDSATVDAQGRAPVTVFWDGGSHELLARTSTLFNLPGGGSSFLPRKGQAVYLGFENGDPSLPVIVGYHPNQNNPLVYDPASSSPQAVLAKTVDASGNPVEPPTTNRYKSVIRSSSQGADAKASEIAMVDHPGQEELSLTSQGEMRLHTKGDHYLTVNGETVANHAGDKTQYTKGDYVHQTDGDYHRTVKGDSKSTVSGGHKETVASGNYKVEVPGEFTHLAAVGRSVHTLWQADTNNLYILGKNSCVVGEEFVLEMGLVNRWYVMREDFYLINTLTLGVVYWENKANGSSNYGTKLKAAMAVLKEAAAGMVDRDATEENAALTLKDPFVAFNAFTGKINDGMKLNF